MNRISQLMLLVGLGGALVIFLTADPVVEDPLLNDPRGQKKFHRELRMIGGTANLLSAEFQEWFASIWQGQALAGTVAVLTIGATVTFRFIATFPPAPGRKDGERSKLPE